MSGIRRRGRIKEEEREEEDGRATRLNGDKNKVHDNRKFQSIKDNDFNVTN